MQGAMAAPARKRRRRFRVASPLDIRALVTELGADALYEELCDRIDALDAIGKPWAPVLLAGGRQVAATTLALLGRPADIRELSPEAERVVIRAASADIVAAYWDQRAYRRGVRLPRIIGRGVPWDTPHTHTSTCWT